MYTRYIRGADGIYRRQQVSDTPQRAPEPEAPETCETPEPCSPARDAPEPVLAELSRHADPPGEKKPPGFLTSLLSRQFDTDDLLLAAIVLLLLLDGGEEDYIALLAALAFLLF